ncbi:hypothetical protein PIROE2DRAFT_7850, partial [Piromyces sp. E2]
MDSFEKKHERGINNMGELLLKGYIMTAEACPVCNCPFFKRTNNSPPFCPLCDEKNNKENENIKDLNNSVIKNNQQINPKENKVNESLIDSLKNSDNKSKKNDSINSKMSELMLAGWTLTNNNCPLCTGVPLMKNKEKQQFCVKCENEEEAKKQGWTIKNKKIDNIKQENNYVVPNNNKIIIHSLDNDKVTQSNAK